MLRLALACLALLAALLAFIAEAAPYSSHIPPICRNVIPMGCVRYVQGFDITGVTTEVDLMFPQVKNACDCLHECVKRKNTCVNFVYKFTPADTHHRTCTLYSNFNLPSNVTIAYNVANSTNIALLQSANNPQGGGLVPQCNGPTGSGTDFHCISGAIWVLGDTKHTIIC